MQARYPINLKGTINWVCESGDIFLRIPIKMAVLRSKDEIALDCENDGFDYSVVLAKKGPQYEGRFNGDSWRGLSQVVAFGKLFSNEAGYHIHGTWREDGYEYHWWAELSPAPQRKPPGKSQA